MGYARLRRICKRRYFLSYLKKSLFLEAAVFENPPRALPINPPPRSAIVSFLLDEVEEDWAAEVEGPFFSFAAAAAAPFVCPATPFPPFPAAVEAAAAFPITSLALEALSLAMDINELEKKNKF